MGFTISTLNEREIYRDSHIKANKCFLKGSAGDNQIS